MPPQPQPPAVLTLVEKVHRPAAVIEAELAEAKATFVTLEAKNRDYEAGRKRALVRREKLEAAWRKESPDDPFDPQAFSPPATVPPADSREFNRHHYVIARLQAELEAAKKAEVGQ